MILSTWLLSCVVSVTIFEKVRQVFSIDILDRDDTYCNEHNLLDLVCVPKYNINDLIMHLVEMSEGELDFENPEPLIIHNKIDILLSPFYSCNDSKSKLIELDSLHKSFICANVVQLQKVLQCESGYKLKQVLVENPSNFLGYKNSEVRLRTEKEKGYAIKSDKLCIQTVSVPVELSCTEGTMKDGFCVSEKTTNVIYECPIGLSVTPKKWCGYIKKELNEDLAGNVIKRTNPGCQIKKVHPWFKSTVVVECYDNRKYTVGVTEEEWVSVMPSTISCPNGYEVVYPEYSNKKVIDSIFVFPPICVSRKYFPRKLTCPGRLLRNKMIVKDRYIVEREINPTPFKQYVDVSHYSCEIENRKKPSIVCPFYTNNRIIKDRHPEYTSFANSFLNDTLYFDEIQRYQSGIDEIIKQINSSDNSERVVLNNHNANAEKIYNNNQSFYNTNNYKDQYHVYYRNEDDFGNYLASRYDNSLESSYYPFRLNTTNLKKTQRQDTTNKEDPDDYFKIHNFSRPHDYQHNVKMKKTNKFNLNKYIKNYRLFLVSNSENSEEYFNNYQWSMLSRFFKVYVSNQDKFVSNIPISPISHEAVTVDTEYLLNINLDPTYQGFLRYILGKKYTNMENENGGKFNDYCEYESTSEKTNGNVDFAESEDAKMHHNKSEIYHNISNTYENHDNSNVIDSETSISNIEDFKTKNNETTNEDRDISCKKSNTQENITSVYMNTVKSIGSEYTDWERSAKIYYMSLDLIKKNQILYSSINGYTHKKKFPYLYEYYSGPPRIQNDFGHVRRPALSDHKYRFGSPSEQYFDYTGRYENSDLSYYIHKHFNHTKPFKHSPGPNQGYNCISINETSPVITCPNNYILIPRCFILDFIYSRIINYIILREVEEDKASKDVYEG